MRKIIRNLCVFRKINEFISHLNEKTFCKNFFNNFLLNQFIASFWALSIFKMNVSTFIYIWEYKNRFAHFVYRYNDIQSDKITLCYLQFPPPPPPHVEYCASCTEVDGYIYILLKIRIRNGTTKLYTMGSRTLMYTQ